MEGEEQARAYCERLTASEATIARLEAFAVRLKDENTRQNLVSSASLEQVWQRHIADSLQLLEHVPGEPNTWLDLGTGAGPPGLVVAIARPDMPMYLIESRKRRAEWLQSVCDELGLSRCVVLANRLEDVDRIAAGVISARAFAPLDRLFRLSTRFSTPETIWLLPKGRSAQIELADQPPEIQCMFHVEPSLTDPQAGIIVGRGAPVSR